MPSHDRTLPSRVQGHPVRTLRAEVIAGRPSDVGASYTAADKDVITVGTAPGNDLLLTDPTASRYHLELRRFEDRILVVDLGSTNGTLVGPILLQSSRGSVASGAWLDVGGTRIRVLDGDVVTLDLGPDRIGAFVGRTPAMRRLMASIQRVAQSDAQVLILGESGTGKELAARAIHDLSGRAQMPFVTVDCGAVSQTLFTSELFGHERGAFTGADRRHVGAFERARGGTLFLDEIGELPAALQAGLLGALERRRIRRVGGSEEIAVDVRVLAATNRDLRADVNASTFRLDLYHRIAVMLLEIPPLRERSADIPLLVEHFLREDGYDGALESYFNASTLEEMQLHAWPGNVRELRNVVEAVLVTGHAPPLASIRAPATASGDPFASLLDMSYRDARAAIVSEFERRYASHLLAKSGGNVRMDRMYLTELLRRHKLR